MPRARIPLISREDLKAKLDSGDDFMLAGEKEEWRGAELLLER